MKFEMGDEHQSTMGLGEPITEGEWTGWRKWGGYEPFEDHVGPFYTRRDDHGAWICGMRVQPKNLRSGQICHGGALVAFADYSLFLLAHDEIGNTDGVTVSLTTDFLAAAPAGALLIARGGVLRKGRSLVFVRGVIEADGTPVLGYSGIVKLITRK